MNYHFREDNLDEIRTEYHQSNQRPFIIERSLSSESVIALLDEGLNVKWIHCCDVSIGSYSRDYGLDDTLRRLIDSLYVSEDTRIRVQDPETIKYLQERGIRVNHGY